MPLMILGIIVLIGILIYAIVQYIGSGETDTRPVKERYPHIFKSNEDPDSDGSYTDDDGVIHPEVRVYTDDLKGDLEHVADDIKDNIKKKIRSFGFDEGTVSGGKRKDQKDDNDPIIFPTDNVEEEKKKRNIH